MVQFEYADPTTTDPRPKILPFAEAFAPMTALAGDDGEGLVEILSRSFSDVLFAEFSTTRPPHRDGRDAYLAFIHRLWDGGWQELFDRYPVLARLVRQAVKLKIAENQEFRSRLEADRERLRATFCV